MTNNQLYEQIYELLLQSKQREDILYHLKHAIKYIEDTYFYYFSIQYDILSLIKDIIWYNLEFLPYNKPFGLNTIETMGTKFNIISQLDNNIILNYENISKLQEELEIVLNEWSNNWKVVRIFSETGISSNNIIIYNKDESPYKYGYCKKSSIIDKNNNHIFSNKDVLLCEVNSIIGDNYLNTILKNKVIDLCNICKKYNKTKYIIIIAE